MAVETSFNVDAHTNDLISSLKEELGLKDNAEVLRRAITLLKIATDNKTDGGILVMKKGDVEKEVVVD